MEDIIDIAKLERHELLVEREKTKQAEEKTKQQEQKTKQLIQKAKIRETVAKHQLEIEVEKTKQMRIQADKETKLATIAKEEGLNEIELAKVKKDMAVACAQEVTKQAVETTKQAAEDRKKAEVRARGAAGGEAHRAQTAVKAQKTEAVAEAQETWTVATSNQ